MGNRLVSVRRRIGRIGAAIATAWALAGVPASGAALSPVDALIDWNARLRAVFRAEATPPPIASRELALLNVAMFEAVNATSGLLFAPYLYAGAGFPTLDPARAADGAAGTIMAALHPGRAPTTLPGNDPAAVFGARLAADLLAARSNDGADRVLPAFIGRVAAGAWRPTSPGAANRTGSCGAPPRMRT